MKICRQSELQQSTMIFNTEKHVIYLPIEISSIAYYDIELGQVPKVSDYDEEGNCVTSHWWYRRNYM